MKILHANKFYFPEYGTEKYLFGVSEAFRERGHEIIPFAMEDAKNAQTNYSKYFVSHVDFNGLGASLKGIKQFGRMVYSWEARKKFAALLDDTQPDIVHAHSIHHQISPSILAEARKRNIPVVQTLHDYKLVCPAYVFPFRNGQVCTECRRGRWLHLILHRAHKNSYLTTAAAVLESFIHAVTRVYERNVDRFIVPSNDMAQRLIKFGVSEKQLSVVPHYIDLKKWQPAQSVGEGILFAGRLWPDRGLDHVLAVAKALPETPVYVAGDGYERASFEAKVKLQELTNVHVLGRLEGVQLQHLFQSARVIYFPTMTLDTFGLTVLEAMASGKPVVTTKLGAMNELVTHGENGFLYDPKRVEDAIDAIRKLLSDEALARNFGKAARKKAEEFSLERHYRSLVELYRDVLVTAQEKSLKKMIAKPLSLEAHI
jgi:glycosyltransferase involved in cell wall biosynthesis